MNLINKIVKDDRLLLFFIIVLFFSSIVFFQNTILNPTSPDSWTHMAIGQYIFNNKHIPEHLNISYKDAVQPSLEWLSHSWLLDLQFFIAGRDSQVIAAFFLLLPNLLISLYILFIILKNLNQETKFILALSPIPILLANIFWKIHPIPFIIPQLLLIFYFYLEWRKNKNWKYILITPLIFLVFSNTYGGLIIIPTIFIISIFLIEIFARFFSNLFKHQPPITGKISILGLAYLLSILVTFLNPYQFRIWFYPLTFFGILEKKAWLSSLSGAITLINQNFLRTPHSSLFLGIFLIYIVILIFSLIYTIIRNSNFLKNYYFLSPLILFLLLPFIWIRFIPISVFMTFPLLVLVYTQFNHKHKKSFKNLALFLTSLFLLSISIYSILNKPKNVFTPPTREIEIIKKLNLPQNILTTQDLTGYTLYSLFPTKVGLDAQDDVFDENELITTFSTLIRFGPLNPDAIKKVTDDNSIGTVLVNKNLGDLGYTFSQINDWALIYFDDNGFLFTKRDLISEEVLNENEIKYLRLNRDLGFDPKEADLAAKEMLKFTKKYPDNYLALGQLSSIYRIGGKFNEAYDTLRLIPQNKWNYRTMTEMGRLQAAQGYCDSSEYWFLQALKDRKEQNYSRAVLDLAVLYAGCLNDKTKAKHYFERYNSFQISPNEREKARQVSKAFGISIEE